VVVFVFLSFSKGGYFAAVMPLLPDGMDATASQQPVDCYFSIPVVATLLLDSYDSHQHNYA